MLKRTLRTAAESVGLMPVSLADCQTAAEAHRQELTSAESARDAATLATQAAYDRNADPTECLAREAAEAAANIELARADKKYKGAEKRLKQAEAREADKAKAEAVVRLNKALATISENAVTVDALAAQLAECRALIDAQANILAECARAGVAAYGAGISSAAMIQHALEHAGALPSSWVGDKSQQPTAADLAARSAGAVRSIRSA